MATSHQPAAAAGRRDSWPGGQPQRSPLLHLTACLAITAISALMTLAFLLLT